MNLEISKSAKSRMFLSVRSDREADLDRLSNTIRERFGITDERLVAQAKGWGYSTRDAERMVVEVRERMEGWNAKGVAA